MIPRGRLDITFTTLFKGIGFCLSGILGFAAKEPVSDKDDTLACLSVRTGLDLTLRTLNFAPGSEILVTGINIPDMFRILDAHGLKSIPLALNRYTLGLSFEEV